MIGFLFPLNVDWKEGTVRYVLSIGFRTQDLVLRSDENIVSLQVEGNIIKKQNRFQLPEARRKGKSQVNHNKTRTVVLMIFTRANLFSFDISYKTQRRRLGVRLRRMSGPVWDTTRPNDLTVG